MVMSFLSRRREGKTQTPKTPVRSPKTVTRRRRCKIRLQLWKRITKPLADSAFVGGVLSQTRAARENRLPPDPMTGTYHKIA
ncbi:MAG: hypothetical protein Q8K90_07120, partial [Brevundimonas sp.]|nr:hypothetical protein [Brevundimonas sp.]